MIAMTNYRWVQGFHINAMGALFGGQLLSWVDEDCTMAAILHVPKDVVLITAGMDRINFFRPSVAGDRLVFEYEICHVGNSSITVYAAVKNHNNQEVFNCYTTLVRVINGVPAPVEVTAFESSPRKQFVEQLRKLRKEHPSP